MYFLETEERETEREQKGGKEGWRDEGKEKENDFLKHLQGNKH